MYFFISQLFDFFFSSFLSGLLLAIYEARERA